MAQYDMPKEAFPSTGDAFSILHARDSSACENIKLSIKTYAQTRQELEYRGER